MTRARIFSLLVVVAASLACDSSSFARVLPPPGQLYFPSGMYLAQPTGAPESSGTLVVASSNFDRRYDKGRLTAIDLPSLSCSAAPAGACLPAFPASVPEAIQIPSLGTIDEKALSSLAGELDGVERQGVPGSFRLLVPSRAEGSLLQVVDLAGGRLTCAGGAEDDCSVGAISLEANRLTATGVPRAPAPFSVSISKPDGNAFVTSLQLADSPAASGQNTSAWTVRVNAFNPDIKDTDFLNLGVVSTQSVVMGRRYAYMSGDLSLALRLIDRQTTRLLNAKIEDNFNLNNIDTTRGLALSPDESELYLLTRGPDALLVMSASGVDTDTPVLSMIHASLLPLGASEVRVVDKPSGGHVAFITCLGTQSYDAVGQSQGSLVIWDDASARPVAVLDGFGLQPYGLAVQRIGAGARVYVGLFGEGQIAVVDVPDLDHPEYSTLVAYLGTSHVCLVNPGSRACSALSPK
jgi:hypothetical protein